MKMTVTVLISSNFRKEGCGKGTGTISIVSFKWTKVRNDNTKEEVSEHIMSPLSYHAK